MSKITTIDRTALKNLCSPIEEALAELGEKTGLKFRVGNGAYGGASGHFKLEIVVDDPEAQSAQARKVWDANCFYFGKDYSNAENTGLRPEDFGTEFVLSGTTYRTTGLELKRRKYPIKVEVVRSSTREVGTTVLLTEAAVPAIRRATDANAKQAA